MDGYRYPGIGVVFDIDDLGGGFYGYKALEIFASTVPADGLHSCLLVEGDTAETLAGDAREFCIGVYGDQSAVDLVRASFEGVHIPGLPIAGRRFIDTPALREQPLVDWGMIDWGGRLVTKEWSRLDHDLCKTCGWGYAPRKIPGALREDLRAELDDLGQYRPAHLARARPANVTLAQPAPSPLALMQQAVSLMRNVALTGDRADLDRAVDLLNQAAAALPGGSSDLSDCLSLLGAALLLRFEREKTRADLDASIAALNQAASRPAEGSGRADTFANLGVGLLRRSRLMGSAADLDAAVAATERALATGPTDDPDRATWLSNLGLAQFDRFGLTAAAADLDCAITALQQSVAACSPEDPRLAASLSASGRLLYDRFNLSAQIADLDAAVAAFRQAADATPANHPARARRLADLAGALRLRFERRWTLVDLDDAIAADEQAAQIGPPDGPDRVGWLADLGSLLIRRYGYTGSCDSLDNAITTLERALEIGAADHADRPMCLSNLSIALQNRFEQRGALADLDDAVSAAEQAVRLTSASDPQRAGRLTNLGNALMIRFERTRVRTDLDDAIAVHEQAVNAASADDPDRPRWLSNVGVALAERYSVTSEFADVDAAVGALREAVAAFPADSPYRQRTHSSLAKALESRFEATKNRADLDAAVTLAEQAVAASRPDLPDHGKWLLDLARLLAVRHRRGGADSDLDAAIHMCRQAAAATQAPPGQRADAARALGIVAADAQRWPEAADGFQTAIELLGLVVSRGLSRTDREHLLEQMSGLASDAAACCVNLRQNRRAAELFEQGRAVLLGQALDSRADLEAVRRRHPDLADSFVELVRALDRPADPQAGSPERAGASESEYSTAARRSAQQRWAAGQQLDQVVAEIRSQGFDTFLRAPHLEQLADVVTDQPLVFVIVSRFGSSALIVAREPAGQEPVIDPGTGRSDTATTRRAIVVTRVPLDALTPRELRRRVRDYLIAYQESRENVDRARTSWSDSFSELTSWLWTAVAGPLVGSLAGAAQAVIVSGGQLGLLPLQAAWTADPSAPTGRRYALDCLAISYAPSARALQAARELAVATTGDRLLSVVTSLVDARTSSADWAEAEGFAAVSGLCRHELRGEKATPLGFLRHAKDADVLHLVCHGRADVYDPLESGVLLAGGRMVSLRRLMESRLRLRLAVLSACETALPGAELPDEVVGLPTGLLQAGAVGVVASHWSVPDRATAMLITEFARLWAGGQTSPALALRRAQQWLRDTTNEQKRQHWKAALVTEPRLPAQVAEAFLEALCFGEPDDRDFADPLTWAAFSYTGA